MGVLARAVPGWVPNRALEEFAKPRGPALRARFCGIFTGPLAHSRSLQPPPGIHRALRAGFYGISTPYNPFPVYTEHSVQESLVFLPPPTLAGSSSPHQHLLRPAPPGIYRTLPAIFCGIFTPPSNPFPVPPCKTSRYFYSLQFLPSLQSLPGPCRSLRAGIPGIFTLGEFPASPAFQSSTTFLSSGPFPVCTG